MRLNRSTIPNQMAGVVFIDGQFVAPEEARMSIFDYGFTWGDCVYDVTSVWKGWFFKLDEHLERFERSCAGFRLTCPFFMRSSRESWPNASSVAAWRMLTSRSR